jgi:hypothetical protein
MFQRAFANPRTILGWLVAVTLIIGASGPASAEGPTATPIPLDVAQAEAYAAQAFEAYGTRDYAGAVALYQKAYAAAPGADALYNIARVYDLGLRDRPLAINAYRRFLSDPGATPDRIRYANERLSLLRDAELAELESSAVKAPRSVGTTASAAASTTADPASGLGWSTLRLTGFASCLLGGVSLGVAIGFGVSVLDDAETANAECEGNRCTSQRGVDAAREASTNATVATTAGAVGAALMLAGVTLWVVGGPADSAESDAPARANVSIAPLASSSELGMTLSGGW